MTKCAKNKFFFECLYLSGQDFKETLSLRFKDRGDLKRKARAGGGM
jgi:hypothetical protein